MSNFIRDGIMGLAVADALGVPVEFTDRESLSQDPVVDMRGYGTYNQAPGTWSDDTSMTLCLVDSLTNGLDYEDIMRKFLEWFNQGKYTPFGEVFDIGNTTSESLMRFSNGRDPLESGGESERDNGNGSLMRILPIVYYLQSIYGNEFKDEDKIEDEVFGIIHNISKLTHGHKRSQIACGVYILIAWELLGNGDLKGAIEMGTSKAMEYYKKQDEFIDELKEFKRLENKDFKDISVDEIKSGGYVVDTLEAAIYCLLNTSNYEDCVLKAVNLGRDTDTVGSVAGGLAGLYYGYDEIPEEWINTIARKTYIKDLCDELYKSINKRNIEKLCAYIPFFETASGESIAKWNEEEKIDDKEYTISYPVYNETLKKFVHDFYKTNLISHDYLEVLREKDINNNDEIIESIRDSDLKLLKAILTNYIRQERFSDGLWQDAVENKVFLEILKRFKNII